MWVDELVAHKASRDLVDVVPFTSIAPQFHVFLGSSCLWNDLCWQNFLVIYLMLYLFSLDHPHLHSEKRESYIVHYGFLLLKHVGIYLFSSC